MSSAGNIRTSKNVLRVAYTKQERLREFKVGHLRVMQFRCWALSDNLKLLEFAVFFVKLLEPV